LFIAGGAVIFFFVFVEMVLKLSGFELTFRCRIFSTPFWVKELNTAVLEKHQRFVAWQGFVHAGVYTYQPKLRYGYKLKPDISINVRNDSFAFCLRYFLPRLSILAPLDTACL
jgi:hypothetical protein